MNIQYDEFGREVRMRSTASNVSSSLQTRRERSPDRHNRRRDRSRSPESKHPQHQQHQQQGGNSRNRQRSRTPPELRGYNRQRADEDAERDVDDTAFADELSRYRATHHAGQSFVSHQDQSKQQQQQQQRAAKKAALDTVVLPAGLEEDEMMKMLGLPSQFDTTHEKHVDGADASGARVLKKRHARQYMNVVRRQQQLVMFRPSSGRIEQDKKKTPQPMRMLHPSSGRVPTAKPPAALTVDQSATSSAANTGTPTQAQPPSNPPQE